MSEYISIADSKIENAESDKEIRGIESQEKAKKKVAEYQPPLLKLLEFNHKE